MTRDEMETVVVFSAVDDSVRIYSSYPPHIKKIVGNESATVVKSDEDSVEALVPKDRFNVIRGFKPKRREMTLEQRNAALQRLAEARKVREEQNDA